jgi:hypothetical protein
MSNEDYRLVTPASVLGSTPSIFMRLVPKWIVRGAIVDEAKARILAALALDDGS